MIEMGPGRLFMRPVDAPETEWMDLGVTEAGFERGREGDKAASAFFLAEWFRPVTFTTSLRAFPPSAYWLLFRRRHPRVSAVRAAYRHRRRMRRFR